MNKLWLPLKTKGKSLPVVAITGGMGQPLFLPEKSIVQKEGETYISIPQPAKEVFDFQAGSEIVLSSLAKDETDYSNTLWYSVEEKDRVLLVKSNTDCQEGTINGDLMFVPDEQEPIPLQVDETYSNAARNRFKKIGFTMEWGSVISFSCSCLDDVYAASFRVESFAKQKFKVIVEDPSYLSFSVLIYPYYKNKEEGRSLERELLKALEPHEYQPLT